MDEKSKEEQKSGFSLSSLNPVSLWGSLWGRAASPSEAYHEAKSSEPDEVQAAQCQQLPSARPTASAAPAGKALPSGGFCDQRRTKSAQELPLPPSQPSQPKGGLPHSSSAGLMPVHSAGYEPPSVKSMQTPAGSKSIQRTSSHERVQGRQLRRSSDPRSSGRADPIMQIAAALPVRQVEGITKSTRIQPPDSASATTEGGRQLALPSASMSPHDAALTTDLSELPPVPIKPGGTPSAQEASRVADRGRYSRFPSKNYPSTPIIYDYPSGSPYQKGIPTRDQYRSTDEIREIPQSAGTTDVKSYLMHQQLSQELEFIKGRIKRLENANAGLRTDRSGQRSPRRIYSGTRIAPESSQQQVAPTGEAYPGYPGKSILKKGKRKAVTLDSLVRVDEITMSESIDPKKVLRKVKR